MGWKIIAKSLLLDDSTKFSIKNQRKINQKSNGRPEMAEKLADSAGNAERTCGKLTKERESN